jgi:hypothetical protein
VVRGRVADALEKLARVRPDLLADRLPELKRIAEQDEVSMVRFHLVMLIGHLACDEDQVGEITLALLAALKDPGAFVKSWAIASLCIVGRVYPSQQASIAAEIAGLLGDPSIAVRTRARKALELLTNESLPFPLGWVKNEQLKHRVSG